ncbi:MAG: ATP-binding protein [Candidatus Aenigmarchaeota archaeon]|nr:ATP-binding protein [Candidatus Aenigmarchaeota archaeon]
MLRKEFINRGEELKFLLSRYRAKGMEFIVISGRRRTGKSRLIEEFLKDKNAIYLLCEDKKFEHNLEKFSSSISSFFAIPKTNFSSFRDCFDFIIKNYKEEKLVIAIDEFSYLAKKSEIIAEMQGIADEILKDKNVMLLLSGSSVSLMQKELLGYKSPLYGRTTGSIILKPLKFRFLSEWFPKTETEELIKIYSCTNGIPKYLEFFSGMGTEKEIEANLFNPNSFLFREMRELLAEELRNVGLYQQLLEAIASGKNKVVEIANACYMNAKDIPAYLNILSELGFVSKVYPLFGTGKKGTYIISDNYTKFWFRFVSRYFAEIDSGNDVNAVSAFRRDYNTYMGSIFEDLMLNLALEGYNMPIKPTKIGRWWHKDKEIDIVALNDTTKEILFAECKWQEKVNAEKIVKELAEKSKFVDWNLGKRKESYAVFAKSFSKRIEEFEGKKVWCFDIKDLERVLK